MTDATEELLRRSAKLLFYPQKGPQEDLLKYKSVPEVLFGGARGGGKLLNLQEFLPTPKGFVQLKDLAVGDTLFDENGEPCTVLELHPINLRPVSYRVHFDDGSTVDACEEHLWLTYNKSERVALHRRTEEFRANRRAKRPSRAKENPVNLGVQQSVTIMNKEREYEYLQAPTGTVRTTREILETLHWGKEVNHSIPVTKPIVLSKREFTIPPYVLGAWLGDGTRGSGQLTGIDPEIWNEIEKEGFSVTHSSSCAKRHNIKGLARLLKANDLYLNKHIPMEYLRSSKEQRLALLQGLMDTDGTVTDSGCAEFCNTNKNIIDGVYDLICSLGWKARIREGRSKLNGVDKGPKWTIKWTPSEIVFRLPRKAEKQRIAKGWTTRWRYIVKVEPIDSVPMRCIKVSSPNSLFLVSRSFIPTHNTAALLGDFVSDVSVYKSHWIGVVFRRTYPELEEVIRQSFEFYPQTGASYNANEKCWKWPNGAKLYLRYMAHPRDAANYQGHQFTYIAFDELGNFATDEGYTQMIACLRSPHDVPHKRIRATANPGGVGHGWVKARFEIAEHPTGYKLIENETGLHRMFIPSKVTDNQILLKADPNYVQRLHDIGSPEMVRAWLHGDWDVVAGAYFPEFNQEHVIDSIEPDDLPQHWKIYRAYDHGTYHPFAVLWYTYAGEDWRGIKKGSIVILREWYGGNDKDEGLKLSLVDIRDGIVDREASIRRRVEPGPADNQIFENNGGQSIADALAIAGIYFSRSDKARIPGWNQIRMRLREHSLLFTRNCRHLLRTFPMLQHDDSKPEDIDTDGADHCFVGSTLVETANGPMRIDEMPESGQIWTAAGLKPYENCGLKQKQVPIVEMLFSNGQKVRCTPDHQFLTKDKKWINASDFSGKICYHVGIWNQQSSVTQSKNLTASGFISADTISKEKASDCIGQCGNRLMVQFLKGGTSTIRTKIKEIISSITWNCLKDLLTCRCTCSVKSEKNNHESTLKPVHNRKPLSGISQKKVEHGISCIIGSIATVKVTQKIIKSIVNSAERLSWVIGKQSFVTTTAKASGGDCRALMTNLEHAKSVTPLFRLTDTFGKSPAPKNAPQLEARIGDVVCLSVRPVGQADVYCLHVPEVENFAIEGGIIVHNCADVARYISMQWPVIPRFDKKRKRSANAVTYNDLVEAVDDVSNRYRI